MPTASSNRTKNTHKGKTGGTTGTNQYSIKGKAKPVEPKFSKPKSNARRPGATVVIKPEYDADGNFIASSQLTAVIKQVNEDRATKRTIEATTEPVSKTIREALIEKGITSLRWADGSELNVTQFQAHSLDSDFQADPPPKYRKYLYAPQGTAQWRSAPNVAPDLSSKDRSDMSKLASIESDLSAALEAAKQTSDAGVVRLAGPAAASFKSQIKAYARLRSQARSAGQRAEVMVKNIYEMTDHVQMGQSKSASGGEIKGRRVVSPNGEQLGVKTIAGPADGRMEFNVAAFKEDHPKVYERHLIPKPEMSSTMTISMASKK